ncbi:MAG: hypothetical protein GY835_27505 [bacterium]|nr:hypothetical protein [bacterium]
MVPILLQHLLTVVLAAATLASAAFAIYQHYRAKASQQRLTEIEKAVTSHKYLKVRALAAYERGQHSECLDTLMKYYANNGDGADFRETIRKIFWDETYKIYGEHLGPRSTIPGLLVLQCYLEERAIEGVAAGKHYPPLVLWLLDNYRDKFQVDLICWRLPVLLSSKSYAQASAILDNYSGFKTTQVTKEFTSFLKVFCQEQEKKHKEHLAGHEGRGT